LNIAQIIRFNNIGNNLLIFRRSKKER